jgi:nitrite reductase/ring-hydroxylating ferredoxin subunit
MKHRVSYSDHVLEGQPVPVEVGGRNVLLVRSAEGLFALENSCPHQCKTMEQGEVLVRSIRCPFHGVEIDLVDGSIVSDAGYIGLSSVQVFKVEETEGVIYLEI